MPVDIVVGANWGDEGKGKVVDYLAAQADIVARFQGGRNAGHTVINEYGKFALHLLPSGVFRPGVINVLGPGVALDIKAFMEEMDGLKQRGVPAPQVRVSDRAQVALSWHALLDQCEEERLGDAKFGSTRVGIAPFYSDKYRKIGIQVADLYEEKRLREGLEKSAIPKNALLEHLYGKEPVSPTEMASELLELREALRPYVCDTTALFHEALAKGQRILLEGQLGAMRDPDHGIYPWCTSSSTLAGYGCVGGGVPPQSIERIVAVTKAYSSCVGAGPFATELFGDEGETLRKRGGASGEYGATTGRPRRVGWFDAVATRYGARVQGATEIAMTNLDVLCYMKEISVCVGYEIDGRQTRDFPAPAHLDRAKAVYEVLPGWESVITGVRSFTDLPANAQRYVQRIEELIECPIGWISVGPQRDAMFRNQ